MRVNINRAFAGADSGLDDFRAEFPFCPIYNKVDPKLDTAFIKRFGTGFEVWLGYGVLKLAREKTVAGVLGTARRFVRHELAHARFTDFSAGKDFKGPFGLLNTFEDIRIEEKERARASVKLGKRWQWHWQKYMPDMPQDTPEAYLLAKKFGCVCNADTYKGQAETASGYTAWLYLERLFPMIQGACTTRELFPILEDFMKEFPWHKDTETPTRNPGTLSDTGKMAGDVSPDGAGTGKTYTDGAKDSDDRTPSAAIAHSKGTPVIHGMRFCGEPDIATLGKLSGMLKSLLCQTESVRDEIGETGNGIHLPGIIAGTPAFRRVLGTSAPVVTVICDMSGSMHEAWESRGLREIAIALAKCSGIKTKVWLTCNRDCLTVDADTVAKVLPRGASENLCNALARVSACNGFGDLCVVLTDGQVTDTNVDAFKYRASGVKIIAAMVGSLSACELDTARKQFGRFLLRPTAPELLREIVREAQRLARSSN